jgi:hypothetical protein
MVKKTVHYFLFCTLIFSVHTYAQKDGAKISGFVTDEISGEALYETNILLYRDSLNTQYPPFAGTVTNSYGFYAIPGVHGFVDKIDNINEVEIGSTMYFVCYSLRNLYDQGHPPNAVFYLESEDLKSTKDLQTLPVGREILIYDYSGQLSAAVTAYLQVLGYNAKLFLYGANQLMYGTMTDDLDRRTWNYAFLPEEINNFPYVTGNGGFVNKTLTE